MEYIAENGVKIIEIISEFEIATPELKTNRNNICNGCEYKNNDMCSNCNCLLNIITSYTKNKCPIGNW